ncbi:MAG TPA: hypothetical protein VFE47_19385 [Tepidisphaeraceae bacterium]|jgi:hypothetical protein|nr:hypothetical protein [Tepidisphaeraceae bacterium]
MSQELFNTSAPRGIKAGSSGFCTVGMTSGMSSTLEERLTLLSGYRWLVPPGEKGAANNPVAYAHWRLALGGKTFSVLSRVCDAGFDYSNRSNRFAHHIVLDASEQVDAGPAWLMLHGNLLRGGWQGEPEVLPRGPSIPPGINPPRICGGWKSAAGDAGWAGVLAESLCGDPSRVTYVIYPPGLDMLPLLGEAMALMPISARWQVTFSTYFSDLPAGMSCSLRCCVSGTKAAAEASRHATSGLILDLTQDLGPPPETAYTAAARTGTLIGPQANPGGWPSNEAGTFDITPAQEHEEFVPPTDRNWDVAKPPSGESQLANGLPVPPSAPPARIQKLPETPARRGTSAFFWAFAILWPIAFVGGMLWYIRSERPAWAVGEFQAEKSKQTVTSEKKAGRDVATTQPQDASENAMRAQQLAATNAKLKSAEAERDAFKAQINQKTGELARLQQTHKAAITEADKTTADAKTQIAGLAGQVKTLTATLGQSNSEEKRLSKEAVDLKRQVAAALDAAVVRSPASIFSPEHEIWAGDDGGAPDAIYLNSYAPPKELKLSNGKTGNYVAIAFVDPSGPVRDPQPLAQLLYEGGRVVFKWTDDGQKQLENHAEIRDWLRLSQIVVARKGKTLASRSLYTGPSTFTMALGPGAESDNLVPYVAWKNSLEQVEPFIPSTPQGWSIDCHDRAIRAQNKASRLAAFDLVLAPGKPGKGGLVLTSTGDMLSDQNTQLKALARKIADSQATADAADMELKHLAIQTNDKKLQEKNKQDAEAVVRTRTRAIADNEQASKDHSELDAAVKAMISMPEFTVQLRNSTTKMVLCTVTLKRAKSTPNGDKNARSQTNR